MDGVPHALIVAAVRCADGNADGVLECLRRDPPLARADSLCGGPAPRAGYGRGIREGGDGGAGERVRRRWEETSVAIEEQAKKEAAPAPVERPRVDRRRLVLLSLGHAVVDSYGQSLLAPLFPLLASRLGLSLAQVGSLPMVMGLSASLGQPILGYLSDRHRRIGMIAIGPAVAAVFSSLVGLAPGYWGLLLLLFLAGLGIGAYHPQGAALARKAAGGSSLAMAAFTVGGNLGFGFAPLLGALGLRLFGLERFFWMALPGLLVALLIGKSFSQETRRQGEADLEKARPSCSGKTGLQATVPPDKPSSVPAHRREGSAHGAKALGFLTATVIVRAAVQIGILTFLPFYLPEHGFSGMDRETARGMAASIFLLANAVGGPLGGHLSDRLGRRSVMLATFLLAPWPLWLGFHLPGYGCLVGLALGGFLLTMPHPANVVMAQELMPQRAGVAASMITGLAWGVAQVLALPLGALADRIGVPLMLQLLSLVPLLGIGLTLPIPESRQEPVVARR